jgi:hypothetical protein
VYTYWGSKFRTEKFNDFTHNYIWNS